MTQYICSMWLGFAVIDTAHIPDAQKAFEKFWPGSIGASWDNMIVEAADDEAFLTALNAEFKSRIGAIKNSPGDLDAPFRIVRGGDWVYNERLGIWEISTVLTVAGGGGHWRFDIGKSRKSRVTVHMHAAVAHPMGTVVAGARSRKTKKAAPRRRRTRRGRR